MLFRKLRRFHFFCKYCGVFTVVLAVVLVTSRHSLAFRSWSPNNLLLTIVVVMSEKIELTVSKGVLRILGTLVGGIFGEPDPHPLISIVYVVVCLGPSTSECGSCMSTSLL